MYRICTSLRDWASTLKPPRLVPLVRLQDLVQLGPLLTMVKVERLGELVQLVHRLVLEVRGVFGTHFFLQSTSRQSWFQARPAGRGVKLTERTISLTTRAMKRFPSQVLGYRSLNEGAAFVAQSEMGWNKSRTGVSSHPQASMASCCVVQGSA